jgi:hypothetical protein
MEETMSAKKIDDKNLTEAEGAVCHICNKGSLVIVNTFGINPPMLECSACGTRFYKNASGELKKVDPSEKKPEKKKNLKNKKPGKPSIQKREK